MVTNATLRAMIAAHDAGKRGLPFDFNGYSREAARAARKAYRRGELEATKEIASTIERAALEARRVVYCRRPKWTKRIA